MEEYLPILLQEYLKYAQEDELTVTEMFVLLGAIPALIGYVVSVVGLLKSKIWAKNLYAVSTLLAYALLPFARPTAEHAVISFLFDLSALCIGAILALLFFTNSDFKTSYTDH